MTLGKAKSDIFKTCDSILNRIKEWDNELQSGIDIIDENEEDIKILQGYYIKSPDDIKKLQLQEEYFNKIQELAGEMETFLTKIEAEKQGLVSERKQFSNSDAVIENYISSDLKPVFIDKDV